MKKTRTEHAKQNILFGMIYKMYQIIIPFFMRTLMIYQMGMEYAGLNNLFTSIFQVLNLAELGIGAALTYSMYAPIANGDTRKISALLKLYKLCFLIIGWVVLLLGVSCVPFLGRLVAGKIPGNLNLVILYLMYLANTVLTYWLFSYKTSLLYAHQRNDVISKVMLMTSTIQYILQAFVLFVLKNYYLYLAASIVAQILQNLICSFLTDKMYPRYRPSGVLEKSELHDIRIKVQGLVTNKIGGTILRSADSVVISAFLGLSTLAVYQNYYFIMTAVISLLTIVFESVVATIGNSLITETKKKNYSDFRNISYVVGWLIVVGCACFIALYQPFMVIWVGEKHLMSMSLVVLMIAYFFLYGIDQLIGLYKDASGIWYSDRYRPLVSSIVNLAINIVLVQLIGLYGVLISTIIALLFVDLPWLIHNVYVTVFKSYSAKPYIFQILKLMLYAFIICLIVFFVCSKIPLSGFMGLLVKFIVAVGISLGIFVIGEGKTEQFANAKTILASVIKRRM